MFDLRSIHKINPYDGFNPDLFALDLQGWNGENPIFKELIHKLMPELILEIGSYKGQSSVFMGRCVKEQGLSTKIICVDTWLGSEDFIGLREIDNYHKLYPSFGYPQLYYQFLANVCKTDLQNIIIPFPQVSTIACRWLKKHKILFDMIYCDGDNDYESQICDIKSAWSILKTGGVIFGDDYGNVNWPGIAQAVNEFVIENNLNNFFAVFNNFWLIKKIKEDNVKK